MRAGGGGCRDCGHQSPKRHQLSSTKSCGLAFTLLRLSLQHRNCFFWTQAAGSGSTPRQMPQMCHFKRAGLSIGRCDGREADRVCPHEFGSHRCRSDLGSGSCRMMSRSAPQAAPTVVTSPCWRPCAHSVPGLALERPYKGLATLDAGRARTRNRLSVGERLLGILDVVRACETPGRHKVGDIRVVDRLQPPGTDLCAVATADDCAAALGQR